MEDFLHYLVEKIVSHPESVHISQHEDEYGLTFSIEVAPDDFGKVIGKKGKTINALRTIFYLYLRKNNSESKKVYLKMVETEPKM